MGVAISGALHYPLCFVVCLFVEVVRFRSWDLFRLLSLVSGENMGKEFDLGAGRTALGDKWRRKSKNVRCLLSCRQALDIQPRGISGSYRLFFGRKLQGLVSWMRRKDRMIRALTNQGVGE
jgi:hypothetical protein